MATRDLIEEKLGDVVKVVYRRRDREEWIFEKDTEDGKGTQAVWRMTSPLEINCVTWEVNKFANRLGSIIKRLEAYQVSN